MIADLAVKPVSAPSMHVAIAEKSTSSRKRGRYVILIVLWLAGALTTAAGQPH